MTIKEQASKIKIVVTGVVESPAVMYVCKECRSMDVKRDAWAVWDIKTQAWELLSTYDTAYCNACEGETTLEEVSLL